MRWTDYIDEAEVTKAIALLQEPGSVFEVRAIGTAKKDILSGYFMDADTLLLAFDKIEMRQRNIYITLGKVKEECFARAQSERFLKSAQSSSDTDIEKYRWLFVDLDPVRSAGISSSDQELQYAEELFEKVSAYMDDIGFQKPITALSGNGYHLLYRIDINNDAAGQALVERCLKVLAEIFNTDKVKIDTTNSNPSRICKLHGTLAQKGRSTKNRPHRMSRILTVPEAVNVTDISVMERLAGELPEDPVEDRKQVHASGKSSFDLLDFMRQNGMTYVEDYNNRATIYKLDECPFDPSHKDGDAKIFLYHDGKIAFKCHHNSCRHYKWQDVRLKFDPEAYSRDSIDDEKYDNGYRKHIEVKQAEDQKQPKPAKKQIKIRKLKSADALMQKQLPEPKVFIGVGEELPLLLEGTCILSAKPKLGKSWLALAMCIAVANGEDFIGYKTNKCSTLYLDLETGESLQQKRLRKMLNGSAVPTNFYLDTETNSLNDGFVEQIEAYLEEDPNIGIVVIDVFQIIRSQAKSSKESEYEHAYRDLTPLNELAQKHHISIILVCHDRKATDPDDPFSNILGSTGLQGAATQMIVMFRKRKDDPVHISVKGKTIDGLPELNVKLDRGKWTIVEGYNAAEREQMAAMTEYKMSDIRRAVLEIIEHQTTWKGKCSEIIGEAVQLGIGLEENAYQIGGFLHRHVGRFLKEDGIEITFIKNGSGSKIYKIQKQNVDNVDEIIPYNVDGFTEVNEYSASEVPFL